MTREKIFYYGKLVLILILIFSCYYACSIVETYDKRECSIYKMENEIVTFEDECGYLWNWKIDSDFHFENENQKYILIIDNNHTDNIVGDDEIVKIKIKKDNSKGD